MSHESPIRKIPIKSCANLTTRSMRTPFGNHLDPIEFGSNINNNNNNKPQSHRNSFHQSTTMTDDSLDLLDAAIADLEARLNLKPGETVTVSTSSSAAAAAAQASNEAPTFQRVDAKEKKTPAAAKPPCEEPSPSSLPDICKLEFKVGVVTKVWVHETADKLYCEEIDVGEADGPRQIASGLRSHFTLEQMLGQRLLVVTNLKPKNLVGFKSHGMVLCASSQIIPENDSTANNIGTTNGETVVPVERVEFVEPPANAAIGQVVTFADLPPPQPMPPSQVEKKKVFAACLDGMRTTADRIAVWNGHAFMTPEGPCTTKTIAGGVLR